MTIETSTTVGDCMGPEWQGVNVWTDTDAPCHAGDVVRVLVGGSWIVKRLEVDVDLKRWFLTCLDGVVPISPYACVPSAIHKVIEKQKRRATLVMPAPQQPDAHSLAVFAAFAEGFVPSMRREIFPGIDVALSQHPIPADFDAKYKAAMSITAATIPAVNPTTPSAPSGLTISQIAGTIVLDWVASTTVPVGTFYRVWESVTSNWLDSNLVFEGASTNWKAIRDEVQRYYWVGAVAGSYSSGLTPQSYGMPAQTLAAVASGSGLTITSVKARTFTNTAVASGSTASCTSPGVSYVGAAGAVTAAWSMVGGYPATIIAGSSTLASFRVTSRAPADNQFLSATARVYLFDTVTSKQADATISWRGANP